MHVDVCIYIHKYRYRNIYIKGCNMSLCDYVIWWWYYSTCLCMVYSHALQSLCRGGKHRRALRTWAALKRKWLGRRDSRIWGQTGCSKGFWKWGELDPWQFWGNHDKQWVFKRGRSLVPNSWHPLDAIFPVKRVSVGFKLLGPFCFRLLQCWGTGTKGLMYPYKLKESKNFIILTTTIFTSSYKFIFTHADLGV